MGRILDSYGDVGYEHEGYAAQVLDDGSTTSTYSDETRPRMVGQVIAACGCGWVGVSAYPYDPTSELFDQDAEELALAEWEHDHAVPVLQRDQFAKWDHLCRLLCFLGDRPGRAALSNECRGYLSAAEVLELLDRILRTLNNATELARELRDHTAAQAEGR